MAATLVATSAGGAAAASPARTTALPGAGHAIPETRIDPAYRIAGRATPGVQTFSCQLTVPAGCYGPTQMRAAYGTDQLSADGTGETIVIIDAYQSPTIQHDLDTFDTLFGVAPLTVTITAPDGITPFDQSSADQTSWAGEITLDVEYAHAIAPKAAINLVLAKSDQDADILSAQKYVINHDLGDVLSQSFGEAEQCQDPTVLAATHTLFQKAAAEHMTVLASSADQGAALPTCDGSSFFKAVSAPASDPNVTGVGGTLLDADGTTGAYNSETTWNEPDFNAASGGGYSTVYPTPAFQSSLNLPSRGVPDVAYNAGIGTGVLTVWSSSGMGEDLVFRFGGTSAGSPQWAGLIALADQIGDHDIGDVNPLLYQLGEGSDYATLFHDITTGDNTYHGAAITIPGFPATTNWDAATGLGSPKANALVPLLAGVKTTLTINPSTAQINQPVTLTATVSDSGTPPTGTVSFYVDGASTPVDTEPLMGDVATAVTTFGAGTHTVVAVYNGDATHGPSPSEPETVTVTGCTTTITTNRSSLTVTSGTTCVAPGVKINGGITVAKGAYLDLENATVNGSISLNAPSGVRICGSHTGSIAVSGATGFVLIGDPGADGCAANTIAGSITATHNTGGLVIVDNKVSGSVLATNNSGAGPLPGQTGPIVSGNHH